MTRVHKPGCLVPVLFAMLALFADSGWARSRTADREPTVFWKRIEEKGVYERIWERLRLYENEKNPVLQSFSVIGRYQGQYAAVDASQGHADEWENRRMFLGGEAVLFQHLTLHAQIRVSEDLDPFYDGLYQAFVEWSPKQTISVSIGREDLLFTGLERSTPSTRIVTFERGLLADQVTAAASRMSLRISAAGSARPAAWDTRCPCFTKPAESTSITFSMTATRPVESTTAMKPGKRREKAMGRCYYARIIAYEP